MIRKKVALIGIILLGLLKPSASNAWGVLGHRIVAEIADNRLNAKAKSAIKKILGNESMAMASTWADFVKSDSSYNYLNTWHYINLNDGLSSEDIKKILVSDTAADAFNKINFLVNQLQNKNLEADKQLMYLRLLIHIMGDIHQPLHVGREEDRGGNKIKVQWFNQTTNLHAVWDEKLIDFQQLSYTEYVANINYCTKQQVTDWQKGGLADWLAESYKMAHTVYAEIKQPEQKLSFKYNFDHIQDLNQQLVKAGVRLAFILNQLFG